MCTSRSAGKEIDIRTWMKNTRRVRSLREYEFVRKSDGEILVKGKTDWVYVDAKTGAPRALPEEVSRALGSFRAPEPGSIFQKLFINFQ